MAEQQTPRLAPHPEHKFPVRFLNQEFLLETSVASDLYHGFAEPLPIIDYHSHLPPGS